MVNRVQTFMPGRINNIQALRAFAAVAVVLFHTGYIVPHWHATGSFGVDIFFVISGYIMARICATNTDFFLRRRLIRILPPYWVMTCLLFVFAIFYPQLLGATRASAAELIRSLLFIPYYKSNGLLRPLLFVGWSLNYEMLFYLAIALGLRLAPRRPLTFASGLLIVLAALCYPFRHAGAIPAFYGDALIFEFVLGILAYEAARRISLQTALRVRGLSLAGLVLSLSGIVLFQVFARPGLVFTRGYLELLSVTILFSTTLLSQAGWDTNLRPLVLLGDASYVLYLVHPYCEYGIGRVVARRLPLLDITHPFGMVVAAFTSILVAVLLHVFVEKPTIALLNRWYGGRRRSSEFGVAQASPLEVAP